MGRTAHQNFHSTHPDPNEPHSTPFIFDLTSPHRNICNAVLNNIWVYKLTIVRVVFFLNLIIMSVYLAKKN